MISAGDFRNGVTIEYEGNVYQIIEFQHVKPGKGAAFVRTKLKNIISGGVVEKTFRPTEKCPTARIDRKDMQYLYSDGDLYYFMDTENFEQIAINKDNVGDALKFVKENDMCKVCSYNGNVFSVEPPMFVELVVTDTEPGFKGDTATGATKPAVVETGATVAVPNNTTNEARALLLLQQEGLLTLKEGVDIKATVNDIASNPKNLQFKEIAPEQLVKALPDVDVAVINGNYAIEGGLKVKDALAVESDQGVAAKTYENIVVVQKKDENNEAIKKLVEVLQSDEIRKYIENTYEGAVVPIK